MQIKQSELILLAATGLFVSHVQLHLHMQACTQIQVHVPFVAHSKLSYSAYSRSLSFMKFHNCTEFLKLCTLICKLCQYVASAYVPKHTNY